MSVELTFGIKVDGELIVSPPAECVPPPPAEWTGDVYYQKREHINLTKMYIAIKNKTADAEDELNKYKIFVGVSSVNKLPAGYKRWDKYAVDHLKRLIENNGAFCY